MYIVLVFVSNVTQLYSHMYMIVPADSFYNGYYIMYTHGLIIILFVGFGLDNE